MLMIALGVAFAVSEGEGADPLADQADLEIVPESMFVPRNKITAMGVRVEGGVGELDFEVVEQPERGEAAFDGHLLYFIPLSGQTGLELVTISVVDEAGHEAVKTIPVSVGRELACSHLGGASGLLGLAGALLVSARRRRSDP